MPCPASHADARPAPQRLRTTALIGHALAHRDSSGKGSKQDKKTDTT